MKQRPKMPVLFVGHGSPMNVVLDNPFTRSLKEAGRSLPVPAAILVVSAHWLTRGTYVTASDRPEQIYDFWGFPRELYEVVYRPPGDRRLAESIARELSGSGVGTEEEWGLDHASWAVLTHMYSKADVPVLEMSLDIGRPERYHYELGKQLSFLRERGVLIIASGNIVHNLRTMSYEMDAEPYGWAREFDAYVKGRLEEGDHEGLVDYERAGKSGRLAVPTNDHYLPLLYAAALAEPGEPVEFFHEGIQHGSVSMRCLRIG
jgi:4,5-DOPA dioxygenase extradiol